MVYESNALHLQRNVSYMVIFAGHASHELSIGKAITLVKASQLCVCVLGGEGLSVCRSALCLCVCVLEKQNKNLKQS